MITELRVVDSQAHIVLIPQSSFESLLIKNITKEIIVTNTGDSLILKLKEN